MLKSNQTLFNLISKITSPLIIFLKTYYHETNPSESFKPRSRHSWNRRKKQWMRKVIWMSK